MYSCREGGVYGQIAFCDLLFCKHASFSCNVGNHWTVTPILEPASSSHLRKSLHNVCLHLCNLGFYTVLVYKYSVGTL